MGMTNSPSASGATGPYLRRIRLTLGPLEEWRGQSSGQSSGRTLQFESDGTMDTLRVSGSFHKTIMGEPSPSTISVYNLARDTRDAIRAGMTKVTVLAGWRNTQMHVVFQGSVHSALSERNGAAIVTKITAAPGHGSLVRGVSSRTFFRGMSVRQAVKLLAGDLPGVLVIDSGIEGIPGALRGGSWTCAGKTRDALNQLAKEYGFSWHIDNGLFRALGNKALFGGVTDLSGNGGGLISVAPALNGPMQEGSGVKIKALYVPGITAGCGVRVNSAVSPGYNGVYRVHTVGIDLDSHGDAWTMDIDSETTR